MKQKHTVLNKYIIITLLSVSMGCEVSSRVLCNSGLTKLEDEARNGRVALAPWLSRKDQIAELGYSTDEANRNIASTNTDESKTEHLGDRDRIAWRSIAEQRLFQIQDVIDKLELKNENTVFHEKLNSLGNLYVLLAGYADQGDPKRLVKMLLKIEKSIGEIRSESCRIADNKKI